MKNKTAYAVTALLLSGCSLAPDFKLPEFNLPAAFKQQPATPAATEKTNPKLWKVATPLEKENRGEWWKIFDDATLNDLEKQAAEANPTLAAAAARVEQARATVRANASTLLPTIDVGANAVRAQPSSAGVAAFGGAPGTTLKPYTLYSAQATASYEVDLFGRVRDTEKSLWFDAEGQKAQYNSVLLALQGDVAQHYFALRAAEAERALLRDTVAVYREAQRIMKKRFELGDAGEQDVKRTESDLAGAEADLLAIDRQYAVLENALAVLLGKLPSEFTFAATPLVGAPPQVPAGLPSSLLERRPDVSAASASMAAANARVGVARTAFFPSLMLTASGGFESTSVGDLFQWSNHVWALGQLAGSALTATVFDNGRTNARVDAARARYDETVASYREAVLTAFRDVEDNLASQRLLAEQFAKQNTAAEAAKRTTDISRARYKAGDVSYFEVVEAQRGALAAQRAAIQLRGQRFMTTVGLIRALGGGWESP